MTKYIIVSPVRDEEKLVKYTLESVTNQTILPAQWVIVNDGSTDKTQEIIEEYLCKNSWIKLINRQDRGIRQPGKGIIEAFYEGLDTCEIKDWEFVVKLDCDLSFAPDYFEQLFQRFNENPKLGIASGKTFVPLNDEATNLKLEPCPDVHTRGPSKVYKKECFEAIGGVMAARGWDTLDDMAAMVKGFEVRSFADLVLVHFRPIGTIAKKKNWVKFSMQHGEDYYRIGYHPLFMLFKTFRFMLGYRPYILFGLNMSFHYYKSLILRKEILPNREIVKKLREIQIKRMLLKIS